MDPYQIPTMLEWLNLEFLLEHKLSMVLVSDEKTKESFLPYLEGEKKLEDLSSTTPQKDFGNRVVKDCMDTVFYYMEKIEEDRTSGGEVQVGSDSYLQLKKTMIESWKKLYNAMMELKNNASLIQGLHLEIELQNVKDQENKKEKTGKEAMESSPAQAKDRGATNETEVQAMKEKENGDVRPVETAATSASNVTTDLPLPELAEETSAAKSQQAINSVQSSKEDDIEILTEVGTEGTKASVLDIKNRVKFHLDSEKGNKPMDKWCRITPQTTLNNSYSEKQAGRFWSEFLGPECPGISEQGTVELRGEKRPDRVSFMEELGAILLGLQIARKRLPVMQNVAACPIVVYSGHSDALTCIKTAFSEADGEQQESTGDSTYTLNKIKRSVKALLAGNSGQEIHFQWFDKQKIVDENEKWVKNVVHQMKQAAKGGYGGRGPKSSDQQKKTAGKGMGNVQQNPAGSGKKRNRSRGKNNRNAEPPSKKPAPLSEKSAPSGGKGYGQKSSTKQGAAGFWRSGTRNVQQQQQQRSSAQATGGVGGGGRIYRAPWERPPAGVYGSSAYSSPWGGYNQPQQWGYGYPQQSQPSRFMGNTAGFTMSGQSPSVWNGPGSGPGPGLTGRYGSGPIYPGQAGGAWGNIRPQSYYDLDLQKKTSPYGGYQ